MITKESFSEGWKHFCSRINFDSSFLDAEAIQFMNEAPDEIIKVLTITPSLLKVCKYCHILLTQNIGQQKHAIAFLESAIAKAERQANYGN